MKVKSPNTQNIQTVLGWLKAQNITLTSEQGDTITTAEQAIAVYKARQAATRERLTKLMP